MHSTAEGDSGAAASREAATAVNPATSTNSREAQPTTAALAQLTATETTADENNGRRDGGE
jgi:hypothetical protein